MGLPQICTLVALSWLGADIIPSSGDQMTIPVELRVDPGDVRAPALVFASSRGLHRSGELVLGDDERKKRVLVLFLPALGGAVGLLLARSRRVATSPRFA